MKRNRKKAKQQIREHRVRNMVLTLVLLISLVPAIPAAAEGADDPGKYVTLEDTIRSFAAILDGECDEIPEQCFNLKGSIDDVYAAFNEMKEAADA